MKQVQISEQLFLELLKYHLGEMQDDPVRNDFIRSELEQKAARVIAHKHYTESLLKSKETAP